MHVIQYNVHKFTQNMEKKKKEKKLPVVADRQQ